MSKYKILFFSLLIVLISYSLVLRTISFFLDSTQGDVINLKTPEWKPAQSQIKFIKNGISYSVEEKIESQNSSNLQQNFILEGNQYLSFQYKISSNENALGFDVPNFLVKLNDEIIFNDEAENNIWKRGYINLGKHKSIDNSYFFEFLPNNTFDEVNVPTLELKEVSTTRFLAKKNDFLSFSVSKPDAEMHLKYSVEENGVIIGKEQTLTFPYEFLITEHFYNNEIEYFSVDSFGNVEDSKFVIVDTDFGIPSKIEDAQFFVEADAELSIVFTSPIDSFSNLLALYEIGISETEITSDTNWNDLEKINPSIHKKFELSNLPRKSVNNENILLKNLDLGQHFIAIKSMDQAENYSEISNLGSVTIY